MPGGNTVLIVDDDAAIRLLCRVNLELDGHRVLDAETIDAARALLDAETVDVVLLDVHVGASDGRDFLRELRETRRGLPVAMLTGTADVDTVSSAAPDGMIPKPFTLEELRSTVERLAALAHDTRAHSAR